MKNEVLNKFPGNNGFIPSNGFISYKLLSSEECYALLTAVAPEVPIDTTGITIIDLYCGYIYIWVLT